METDNKEANLSQPKMSINRAADFLNVSAQAVHKQLKSKQIVCPKIGNKSYITYKIAKQMFGINFKHKVIVGQIVKGGTGKTTTIDNIASCVNTYGARVLKIDIDPQGNLTDANGVDAEQVPVLIDHIKDGIPISDCIVPICEGVDLIASRIENVVLDNELVNRRLSIERFFLNVLEPIQDNYDFIFIDCPPTMGQAVTAASLYADIVLAPLNPDKFSAKGLNILKNEIEGLNRNYSTNISYRVYLNKFSSKTILSEKAIVSLISDPELEGKVLQTTVQYAQEIPNITDEDKNVFCTLKRSSVRDDFDRLTRELLEITAEQAQSNADDTPTAQGHEENALASTYVE